MVGAPALTMAAAPRRPADGRHLHHHAPGAVGAEPRRLELPPARAPTVVTLIHGLAALVAEHRDRHNVSFKALIGI